jgi:ribosome biogenesis GTPase
MAETEAVAQGAPVHPISVVTGEGLADVLRHLGPGRTGALLGSSGVGKSTLINALVGEARLRTQEVRASDSRGRHTTRHRQLIALPDGRGLLIDTPGMRELQLWGSAREGLLAVFPEVMEMAAHCRFRDCRHEAEPGCAVHAALEAGALAPKRFASFLKLRAELESLGSASRSNPAGATRTRVTGRRIMRG